MSIDKDLTIVIVIYDSSDLIFDCIETLYNFEIIVVDNGKNTGTLDRLAKFKNIKKIITKNKNLGFGNAVNFAFSYINTDYFLVLNPDTRISENSINELLKISKNNKNCAISAPYIVTDLDSYGMLPEKGKGITRNSFQKKTSQSLDNLKPSGNLCVEVTKGCVLLINSRHFEHVGMFSKEYFLFWEEIDLCRKFLTNKLSVIISPYAIAHHKEGASTKKNLKNFFIRSYYSEKSPLYYFRVKKNSLNLYKKMIKYLFRFILYLLIFNFKNSLKNIAKLSANLTFILSNDKTK